MTAENPWDVEHFYHQPPKVEAPAPLAPPEFRPDPIDWKPLRDAERDLTQAMFGLPPATINELQRVQDVLRKFLRKNGDR